MILQKSYSWSPLAARVVIIVIPAFPPSADSTRKISVRKDEHKPNDLRTTLKDFQHRL